MKRRFVRRTGRRPVNVQWSDVSGNFLFSAQASTAAVILVQLQSPTSLAALTSDPPEDLTVLRMRGSFRTRLDASAFAGNWTLALMVQDVTWTPAATFNLDADKRILWSRTYSYASATSGNVVMWSPPGTFQDGQDAGTVFPCQHELVTLDIAPKVRIQNGQALYLVAYENLDGSTLSVESAEMRLLYKRSGRR